MPIEIDLHLGSTALNATHSLIELYRDAFCAPPWNEDESRVADFASRLESDVERPGFAAAIARLDGRPVGFGTAWHTQAPFPAGRRYGDVATLLGPERVAGWLVGAQEIDELAVAPEAQGCGVGSRMLDILTGLGTPRGTWLLTSTRSPVTVPFYRRRGWRQVNDIDGVGEQLVVFLSPRHPFRDEERVRDGR